eukprot:scaffold149_cov315-Pinguiococcus_pyrenoidosus.AAC.112
MTTTDTKDVQASVDQIMKCHDMGADLVRLTVQGRKEAEAAMKIRESLFQKGRRMVGGWKEFAVDAQGFVMPMPPVDSSASLLTLSTTRLHQGYDVPLVADIHFQPKVALMVADAFEKIRVNPGNFADGTKSFEEMVRRLHALGTPAAEWS